MQGGEQGLGEGSGVVYAVEWEEIKRRTRKEKQTRATQAGQSEAKEGEETRTRASQPFQPRLRPSPQDLSDPDSLLLPTSGRIMIYGPLLLSKAFRLPVT